MNLHDLPVTESLVYIFGLLTVIIANKLRASGVGDRRRIRGPTAFGKCPMCGKKWS